MPSWNERIQAAFANCQRGRDDMHAYQDGEHGAVQFLKANPFSALFIDLGLGKTVISLTAIYDLVREFESDCCLVIAPLRVANETWPTEIGQWRHTAALSMHRIRDEELIEQVNAAGAAARATLKALGTASPTVQNFVRQHRFMGLKRRAKNLGHSGPGLRRYADSKIDEEMAKPVSAEERKLFVKQSRQGAAAQAVRDQKAKNPASIYIINREQIEFLVTAWGRDWPYDTVFIDESSSLKEHRTVRWKALNKVRPLMRRMHQLTATPAAESYLHLFGQIYLLDRGERLGKSFTAFTEAYFKHNKYDYSYKLLPGADEQIAKKISDICLTMKAEDYLSLEKPVMEVRRVGLSNHEHDLYKAMERDSVLTLGDREITADTAAALSSKLLQMASGVLYDTALEEDPITGDFETVKRVHPIHDHKINDLAQLREDASGEPLLVAYHFKSSLERLQRAFPDAQAMGREGREVKLWNQRKIPMLLVHPQSAGHGLNLQHGGRHVVFFDLPWSLELYLQLIGRLARQGQTRVVYVHHLVAAGTIDEVVMQCLLEKRDSQETLFRWLKAIRGRNQLKLV